MRITWQLQYVALNCNTMESSTSRLKLAINNNYKIMSASTTTAAASVATEQKICLKNKVFKI